MTITSDTSDSASAVGPVPGSDAADAASRPGSGRADFFRFLGTKLAAAAVSFVIVLGIGFVIFQLMPSDPVQTMTRGRPPAMRRWLICARRWAWTSRCGSGSCTS